MKRHFGIDDITLESAKKVAEHFNDINYKGYFEKIYDDNNVEAVLSFVTYHKGCFTDTGRSKREYCVPHIGDYSPISSERLSLLEQESDIKISSLRDVDSAIDTLVKFYKTHRAPALKVSSGYYRLLDIHDADAPTAELYLEKVVNGDELTDREKDVLDDYCLHLLCKKAQKYDLPVIFHVGIHAGGQNMLERARANYLTNLVSTYKGVNFVILHCGIPYIEEAVMLSKYYTNVFLDMTWTHIIDAHKTVELIKQIVEAVPINKVFAFGGDLSHPYNGMAHLSIAKDNLARAFSQLIEMERMTDLDAENIIKMWLYDNPKQFYKL